MCNNITFILSSEWRLLWEKLLVVSQISNDNKCRDQTSCRGQRTLEMRCKFIKLHEKHLRCRSSPQLCNTRINEVNSYESELVVLQLSSLKYCLHISHQIFTANHVLWIKTTTATPNSIVQAALCLRMCEWEK